MMAQARSVTRARTNHFSADELSLLPQSKHQRQFQQSKSSRYRACTVPIENPRSRGKSVSEGILNTATRSVSDPILNLSISTAKIVIQDELNVHQGEQEELRGRSSEVDLIVKNELGSLPYIIRLVARYNPTTRQGLLCELKKEVARLQWSLRTPKSSSGTLTAEIQTIEQNGGRPVTSEPELRDLDSIELEAQSSTTAPLV